ncbi:hypothetical protein Dimus_004125 [Dionaea muscipula]
MLVHVDAVKEFYAKMTVIHLKKKDVVKSSVKGISIEFDHERLATILGVLEELESVNTSRRCGKSQVVKKGEEPKRYDYFEETFLTMCKLTRENGIWWIGSGENRRRDNDVAAPEEEAEKEDERNKDDFDWEAVIDEATVEGESGSDDQFYDAQVEVDEPMMKLQARLSNPASSSLRQKDKEPSRFDPSCPTGRLPEAEFLKFQAEFERKRANRFHDDLEKAKAENARLLALLHQAQTKPHP